MEAKKPKETRPKKSKAKRNREPNLYSDPREIDFPPAIVTIASGSEEVAMKFMALFHEIYGDEARYSMETDGTEIGGWPLTISIADAGCEHGEICKQSLVEMVTAESRRPDRAWRLFE